jgi:hypothetical protein
MDPESSYLLDVVCLSGDVVTIPSTQSMACLVIPQGSQSTNHYAFSKPIHYAFKPIHYSKFAHLLKCICR